MRLGFNGAVLAPLLWPSQKLLAASDSDQTTVSRGRKSSKKATARIETDYLSAVASESTGSKLRSAAAPCLDWTTQH